MLVPGTAIWRLKFSCKWLRELECLRRSFPAQQNLQIGVECGELSNINITGYYHKITFFRLRTYPKIVLVDLKTFGRADLSYR